jgi:hypothetical protein
LLLFGAKIVWNDPPANITEPTCLNARSAAQFCGFPATVQGELKPGVVVSGDCVTVLMPLVVWTTAVAEPTPSTASSPTRMASTAAQEPRRLHVLDTRPPESPYECAGRGRSERRFLRETNQRGYRALSQSDEPQTGAFRRLDL